MSPRIQEYLPEQEAAQPQGGVSANLDVVGQLGHGVESFGRGVSEVSDVLASRSAMMESADAQSQVSETKSDFFDRVKDETNRGVLDQEKVLGDYDKWVDETGSKFSTPRGKAEFERASGRTRGSLIRWAAQGSAQIAGANALANHTTTVNNLTDLTLKDPHSFADNMGQLDELYSGYHNDPNMNKNPIALQKMKQAEQSEIASAAIQGQMKSDFDSVVQDMVASGGKIDPTDSKYNVAQGMLNTGVYDNYIDSKQKETLSKSMRANFSAAQTEGQRVLNVQSVANERKIEEWRSSVVDKMATGQLSTKDILSGAKQNNMTAEATLSMIKENAAMAKLSAEKKDTTPPNVYNEVNTKILSGEIASTEDLMKYGSRGLTGSDFKQFHSVIDNTPAGKANLANEKSLTKWAEARTVGEAEKLGDKAPGEYQLMLWNKGLQAAKQQAVANGKPVSSVLDPTSPDFFGKNTQFFMSATEMMKQQAEQVRRNLIPQTGAQKQDLQQGGPPSGTQQTEESVPMTKDGVTRLVPKSKVKEATSRGYSTGASNNETKQKEVVGPSPASSPQEPPQFPINESLTPPPLNDKAKATNAAYVDKTNEEKQAQIAQEMEASKKKKKYLRSHLEE